MIEPVPANAASPSALAICDKCGASHEYTCDYERSTQGEWTPHTKQVIRKAQADGWQLIRNKLLCPACVLARKTKGTPVTETATAPTEATRKQQREIISLLETVYDDQRSIYKGRESDATVAAACDVLPEWVAEVRERLFGPLIEDPRIQETADLLAGIKEDMDGVRTDMDRAGSRMSALSIQLEAAEKTLAALRSVDA